MSDNRPIGIFDSGIGGLTVLREIRKLLPTESIIYLGDTARVPYGAKSGDTVIRYSVNNTRFLLQKGVKMIVVACNTASAYALLTLEKRMRDIPIIGVLEGGVIGAVEKSDGRIGVIATEATINSGSYFDAIKQKLPASQIICKACPLFVSLVEESWTDNHIAYAVADLYLGGLKGKIDTLLLGCTHYPLLKTVISSVLGADVSLIDSAEQTAKLVKRRLLELDLTGAGQNPCSVSLFVTDSPERSLRVGKKVMGEFEFDSVELVDI